MAFALEWDKSTEKIFETGCDRGVLWVNNQGVYGKGEVWNGLTGVTDSPSGAESTDLYADNGVYLSMTALEKYGLTIEAYMYPQSFAECNGETQAAPGLHVTQQDRKLFAFSWRTLIGDDVAGDSKGYKIHIAYGCKAAPSEKAYSSKNDNPEAMTLSWEVTTTPVKMEGYKPMAKIVIDSLNCPKKALQAIEEKLYGTASPGKIADTESKLLMPDDIKKLIEENPDAA